jgi:hypothetical protein
MLASTTTAATTPTERYAAEQFAQGIAQPQAAEQRETIKPTRPRFR